MILKIKREDVSQGWWILDKIDKVGVGHLQKRTKDDIEVLLNTTDYDIMLLDNMFNISQGTTPPHQDGMFRFIVLICRKTNGDEFSVIFDTVAYLCNDEGKTIEKIVA